MAIPWLIGGAIAAAVAYALSDDDKPSSSGTSSSSDDAARIRQEAADKERKERERDEKQQAAREDFQKQGRSFGKSLAQSLPADLVQASLPRTITLDFDLKQGRMQFDLDEATVRDEQLFAAIGSLNTILTKRRSHQKIIENLVTFSELYKPDFEYSPALKKREKQLVRLDRDIDDLKDVKSQLKRLEKELASTSK